MDKQGIPSFQVGHSHESNTFVNNVELPPKRFDLIYELRNDTITWLMSDAINCSQEIIYEECGGVALSNKKYNYILDRSGHVLQEDACNCPNFKQCQNSRGDIRATVTHKSLLPISAIGVGDTGGAHESTNFRIGKLRCSL